MLYYSLLFLFNYNMALFIFVPSKRNSKVVAYSRTYICISFWSSFLFQKVTPEMEKDLRDCMMSAYDRAGDGRIAMSEVRKLSVFSFKPPWPFLPCFTLTTWQATGSNFHQKNQKCQMLLLYLKSPWQMHSNEYQHA